MSPNMETPLNVVDTNVLFNWAGHLSGMRGGTWITDEVQRQSFERKLTACARFCEDDKQEIVIPIPMWAELLGAFLHKAIDVADYARYCQWYRIRRAVLDQILLAIECSGNIRWGDDGVDYRRAVHLTGLQLPQVVVSHLRGPGSPPYASTSSLPPSGRPSTAQAGAKLLDGNDSVVLAEAWRIAEARASREVCLVSDDRGLGIAVRHLRSGGWPGAQRPPRNLRFRRVWDLVNRYVPSVR